MKSRHVSAGFLASQIVAVSSNFVYIDEGLRTLKLKPYALKDLNGREEDEVREFLKNSKIKENEDVKQKCVLN